MSTYNPYPEFLKRVGKGEGQISDLAQNVDLRSNEFEVSFK